MPDPSAAALASFGIQRAGVVVTFQRFSGVAPNRAVSASAQVVAIVRNKRPDTTEEAKTGFRGAAEGAISQDQRDILVQSADLVAQGFPVPPVKGDKIVTATGDKFNIVEVDSYKRALSDTIEIVATGVA